MSPTREATEALIALLRGRGRSVWRTGAAAISALRGLPDPVWVELLTDATPEECEEISAVAARVADLTTLRLHPIGAQPLEEALRARGLTVDAIAVSASGEVVDPFEGRSHLQAGVLRTVGSPEQAFRESPILLLSAARVISWTDVAPSSELRRFAIRDGGNILDVPDRRNRWGVEMNALLLGVYIERALQWLDDTHVLAYIAPEVAAMVGFHTSSPTHHKDIWDHTKLVTQKAVPDLVVRWAALCHDIGKVWTRSITRGGKVHFFRHEDHGALLFESLAHRFGLSDELTQRVAYLIRNHSRVNLYRDDWTDSAVRRLIKETTGHLDDLLSFSKADFTTKRESRIDEMRRLLADLEARIACVAEEDAKVPPLGKGIGVAIMERFALPPSRVVGDIKRRLEDAIAAGTLPERAEDAVYLVWIERDEESMAAIRGAGGTA